MSISEFESCCNSLILIYLLLDMKLCLISDNERIFDEFNDEPIASDNAKSHGWLTSTVRTLCGCV